MRKLHNPIKPPYQVSAGFDFIYPNTLFYKLRGLAGKKHNALDIVAGVGTPVYAPERLQVHEVVAGGIRSRVGYGKFIRAVSLEDKVTEYLFAHLDVVPYPRIGKIWQANEVMSWTGTTGFSSGPHLHFSIKRGNQWINPKEFEWV